ncbi:MAG: phosphate regulon sensor histidine kinase PhoR [Methylococcales bacterium]|mgnify:CR=1 FL=1|nr:phosphate regulon sensor histidine kinase PhoR [Methylococcales bacterium]MBT7410045.1 phosphate regulon sensor histidine kinase PhoR [Methylococcales bacterium]
MTACVWREIRFLSILLMVLLIISSITGYTLAILFTGLVGYTLWNLYHINRLSRWLNNPSKKAPESKGVWDDVYYQLYQLYKRQRKARRRLKNILQRFQESTHVLPYAVIVLDSRYNIEWFNPAAKTMFKLNVKSDIGHRIDNLIRLPEFSGYLLNKKFDHQFEFKLAKKAIALSVTPYGQGQLLISARDITQQFLLDNMRRDFVSNASHELRTPVTVIMGYIELLLDKENVKKNHPLEKIQQQSKRLENIISELLVLAKLEAAQVIDSPAQLNTKKLLTEVFDDAIALDNGRHKLSTDIDSVKLNGRYAEIRMAISNLLTNAIRYTDDGGHIKLFAKTDPWGVTIGVKDDGIGIDYTHVSRLTERFYRVDEGRSKEQGGTGLGLAIVKQILDRHGAQLRIQSTPGHGSVFSCYFALGK